LKSFIPLILALLLFSAAPLKAQEQEISSDEEIDLEFSEEEDFELDLEESEDYEQPSPFRYALDHQISYRVGENTSLINNRSGLSIEYSESIAEDYYLMIDLYGNLYWANDHVADSAGVEYQAEGFVREAWVQRSFEYSTLKLGYQNIVWNEVEGSLATDLVNPVDYRELFFVDFEEARISQLMLSIAIYGGGITWEGFINPQPQFDKSPPANSIYHFASPLDDYTVQPSEKTDPEMGLKGQFKLGASEISLMTARLMPNQKSYSSLGETELVESADPFMMYGATFNYPLGTILFKGDFGYKTQEINDQDFGLHKKNVIDLAFAIEYTKSEHLLSANLSGSRIQDWDESIIYPEQTAFYTLGWSKSYLSEDLSLNAWLVGVTGEPVTIFGLYTDYKFDDALSLQASLFLFSIEDPASEFYAFRNEDRASLKMTYKL
jgi:hypothetical protein